MLKPQQGFTIVELMIAVTLALVLSFGLLGFFASYFQREGESVALSDFRTEIKDVSDLMTNEIRRIGYWGGSLQVPATKESTENPFSAIQLESGCIIYSYDRDHDGAMSPNEQFGFRLNTQDGRIYFGDSGVTGCDAGNWHPLTGSGNQIKQLAFELVEKDSEVKIRAGGGATANVRQRSIRFTLVVRPVGREEVKKYESTVRIMNDVLEMEK